MLAQVLHKWRLLTKLEKMHESQSIVRKGSTSTHVQEMKGLDAINQMM